MVRRNAVAHEPKRRREPLEHVHFDAVLTRTVRHIKGLQDARRSIETTRSRPHDCKSHRLRERGARRGHAPDRREEHVGSGGKDRRYGATWALVSQSRRVFSTWSSQSARSFQRPSWTSFSSVATSCLYPCTLTACSLSALLLPAACSTEAVSAVGFSSRSFFPSACVSQETYKEQERGLAGRVGDLACEHTRSARRLLGVQTLGHLVHTDHLVVLALEMRVDLRQCVHVPWPTPPRSSG